MNDGFTKLFSEIITSSIWSEDDKTRIMWITILALADQHGHVKAALPGLAAMARMSIEDSQKATQKLEAPDDFSRTTDHEGRRIEKVDGGWFVLNHGKFRDRERAEKRREYMKNLMAERRSGVDESELTEVNSKLTGDNPSASVSGSASASDKKKRKGFVKPTADEVTEYGKTIDYDIDGETFVAHYDSNGWMVGKNHMKNWKSAVVTWKKREEKHAKPRDWRGDMSTVPKLGGDK